MASTPSLHLERIRRREGISLEEIAERTKISTRFLHAIETENFDQLPGGVFDTNYIRQYALAIGCHPEFVLQLYHSLQKDKIAEEAAVEDQIVKARPTWSDRFRNWWSQSAAIRS